MFDRKSYMREYMREYMKGYRKQEGYNKMINAYRQTKEYKERYRQKRLEKLEKKKQWIIDVISEEKKEKQREYWRRYREKNKNKIRERMETKEDIEFWNVHNKCKSYIRYHKLRPKKCRLCWQEWNIVAHHPDYNYWNKVVFCCISCHMYIHNWMLKCPEPVDLLELSNSH